jgi:UDP-N-acetylglucosamine--N-acetylmuramyl-(pentapeptide) pyrophosphoryl-undecaprenol N-acetylglucosamine transferase
MSICEALIDAGHNAADVKYVGTIRGVETSLMADSPVESLFLPISGLQRSFSARGILRNMALPWRLLRSRLVARRFLSKWSPKVVVSVGGYASEPMSRAAIAAGIPLVCVSYDHLAGLATRRQAKHAQVCAVAFADSNLPRAHVTGAPVRRELRNLLVSEYRSKARHVLGIPEGNTLIVFMGGSLGSQSINTVAVACSQQQFLFDGTNISVLHICGERFLQEPMPEVANGIEYQRVGYESRMAEVYAALLLVPVQAPWQRLQRWELHRFSFHGPAPQIITKSTMLAGCRMMEPRFCLMMPHAVMVRPFKWSKILRAIRNYRPNWRRKPARRVIFTAVMSL